MLRAARRAAQLLAAATQRAPCARAEATCTAATRPPCAAARRALSGAAGASGRGDAPPVVPPHPPPPREIDIAIDRSGLYTEPEDLHAARPQDTPLETHLRSVIRFRGGPLSVADFMSETLTHPTLGYYMTRDVFGARGDFVTSPEVSQLFGELCAVWAACLWEAMGRPARLQVVELGPGRGTLMADLLRGASALRGFGAALEVHLVEVSPALRRMQAAALGCGEAAGAVGAGVTRTGTRVRWHASLATVPPGPLVLFAHEFFDALPVHQFQRTPRGWCERLVDVGVPPAPGAPAPPLRFVLSRGPTPAAQLLVPRRLAALPPAQADAQWALEISPRAMGAWEEVARRVGTYGGGALAVDYGEEGPLPHSLQAIRQHAFVDLLDKVGTADLSAYVDFGALRLAAEGVCAEGGGGCGGGGAAEEAAGAAAASSQSPPPRVRSYGPVTQRALLGALGIEARLNALLQRATEQQAEALIRGAQRLVGTDAQDEDEDTDADAGQAAAQVVPPGMGVRYKAMALLHADLPAPVGFDE